MQTEKYVDNSEITSSSLDWVKSFNRTFKGPIDITSLFYSLEDAKKYAKGETDERNLSAKSYIGQVISVYDENNKVSVFKINGERELETIGSGTIKNLSGETYSFVISYDNGETETISFSEGDLVDEALTNIIKLIGEGELGTKYAAGDGINIIETGDTSTIEVSGFDGGVIEFS